MFNHLLVRQTVQVSHQLRSKLMKLIMELKQVLLTLHLQFKAKVTSKYSLPWFNHRIQDHLEVLLINHNPHLEILIYPISMYPTKLKKNQEAEINQILVKKLKKDNKYQLKIMHSTLDLRIRRKTHQIIRKSLLYNKLIHLILVNKNKHFKLLLLTRIRQVTCQILEMIIILQPKTNNNQIQHHHLTQ